MKFSDVKPRARRLATIVAWINENRPELRVTMEPWTTSTDTKVAGTRFRRQGKGRKGHRFKVYRREGGPKDGIGSPKPIFDHESGEKYRCNADVERWLETYLKKCLKGNHSGFWPSDTTCQTCGVTFKLSVAAGTRGASGPRDGSERA